MCCMVVIVTECSLAVVSVKWCIHNSNDGDVNMSSVVQSMPYPYAIGIWMILLLLLITFYVPQNLTHEAIRKRHSRDNVSVILIILHKWYWVRTAYCTLYTVCTYIRTQYTVQVIADRYCTGTVPVHTYTRSSVSQEVSLDRRCLWRQSEKRELKREGRENRFVFSSQPSSRPILYPISILGRGWRLLYCPHSNDYPVSLKSIHPSIHLST
jgi:small-conductance mechanosensitive channel